MTKVELLEYYQTELLNSLKANKAYKEALDKENKANEELIKTKGLSNIYQLNWNERICFTYNLKKYPKAKIKRLRLLIQELMLEIERDY